MKNFKSLVFIFSSLFILYGYGKACAHHQDVVIYWNNAALNRIQTNNTPPPRVARLLYLTHVAAFNAFAAYDDDTLGTTRGATLKRPKIEQTKANKEEAISFAAFRVLLNLFPAPADQTYLRNQLVNLGYNPDDISTNLDTPSGIGNAMAFDILSAHAYDGANQLGNEPGSNGLPYSDYVGYVPVNSPTQLNFPSLWQPLAIPGGQQQFLLPIWGFVQAFAITSICEFQLPPPATYPSEEFTKQAKEILRLSAELNDLTKSIAEYWADGAGTVTPPGHWNLIAQYVSQRDGYNLGENAKLFFVLNAAMHDAAINVWYVKLLFNSARPISAIRFLFQDELVEAWGGPCQGTQTILGQNFQPYIATPPFPEYSSGHSAFSAAAAKVLTEFTGSPCYGGFVIISKGSSEIEPNCNVPSHNVILRWKTFKEAADQAGMSRRYGGIHFKQGDLESRKLGRKIGQQAFEKALCFIGKLPKPFDGDCKKEDSSSSSSSCGCN
jgi:hypothetical protein